MTYMPEEVWEEIFAFMNAGFHFEFSITRLGTASRLRIRVRFFTKENTLWTCDELFMGNTFTSFPEWENLKFKIAKAVAEGVLTR